MKCLYTSCRDTWPYRFTSAEHPAHYLRLLTCSSLRRIPKWPPVFFQLFYIAWSSTVGHIIMQIQVASLPPEYFDCFYSYKSSSKPRASVPSTNQLRTTIVSLNDVSHLIHSSSLRSTIYFTTVVSNPGSPTWLLRQCIRVSLLTPRSKQFLEVVF